MLKFLFEALIYIKILAQLSSSSFFFFGRGGFRVPHLWQKGSLVVISDVKVANFHAFYILLSQSNNP